MRSCLLTLSILTAVAYPVKSLVARDLVPSAVESQPPAKVKSISPHVIAAWEKAGAHYEEVKLGALPSFWFSAPNCLLSDLPAPDAPFELIVDKVPEGIARFDNLQSLVVRDLENEADCQVVATLKNLRSLFCNILNDAGTRQLKACPQLRVLRIGGNLLTDGGVVDLCALKDLEEIQLGSMGGGCHMITEWGIEHLANIRSLKKISLWGMEGGDTVLLTDAGIKSLATLGKLEEVELGNYGSVTDAGIRSLGSLPSLRKLSLWELEVKGEGIAGFKGLKSLSLNICPITDAGLKSIAGLRDLEVLTLSSTGDATEAGMKELAALTKLRELCLRGFPISDASLKQLSVLQDLRSLGLDYLGSSTSITDDGLHALQELKNLRALFLPEKVTDRGLKALAGMKLRDLYIPETAKTEIGFKHYLAACDVGTELNLYSWHPTDASLREIKDQKQLKSLKVAGPGITDAGLRYLSGLTGLEELCLKDTNITDAGLKVLAGLPNLRTLEIEKGSKVKGPGLKELGQLPQLSSLDLSGTLVGNEGVKHLSSLKCLEHLVLSGTHLKDGDLSALGTLEKLKTLDLSNTDITDAALNVLRLTPRLEELNLDGTTVTDLGIKALAEMRHLQGLTCITLNDTKVTDAGLVHLHAFKELVKLNLGHTGVTVEGLKGLADMKTLRFLWIDAETLGKPAMNGVDETLTRGRRAKENLQKAFPRCWLGP